MKTIHRKSKDRLLTQISWLKSHHTFSFAEHYDPNWMGFRNLRVINDDYIEPNQGFPMHPHRNMEIVTFMLNGKLRHQDSLGNKEIITPGEIQVMSAGSGIIHSEFSESDLGLVHLLQIWILPKEHNIKPRYDQKQILNNNEKNFLKVIATSNPTSNDIMNLNAHAQIWQGSFENNFNHQFSPTQYKNLWIHVFEGEIIINNEKLVNGDAIGILDVDKVINIQNSNDKKVGFLIFELD